MRGNDQAPILSLRERTPYPSHKSHRSYLSASARTLRLERSLSRVQRRKLGEQRVVSLEKRREFGAQFDNSGLERFVHVRGLLECHRVRRGSGGPQCIQPLLAAFSNQS